MQKAITMSKQNINYLLADVSPRSIPSVVCSVSKKTANMPNSWHKTPPHHDDDFDPTFAPSEMRCLALVSHNEMKATMKKFIIANKNILKKFCLTGTNSTMTMLKDVFKGECNVFFGPSCQSGPLRGDTELVYLMCSGRLSDMLFFQDPMSSHPHQSDIDCLVCQALVHNTLMANTSTSALMMMNVFCGALGALKDDGKPEWMPSFFFTLQSPAVTTYKAA
jgi:methylglyoxal synthase